MQAPAWFSNNASWFHSETRKWVVLGARYGVHRGTAARWLERCNRTLLDRTRRALVTRLRVARTEVDSILRLVRSRLEVRIRAALAAEDAAEGES